MSGLPSGDFWRRQRVLLTGHTGFKGGWAAVYLQAMGAEVAGYALEPATGPSLFEALSLAGRMSSTIADVRDLPRLRDAVAAFAPTVVIHMAAQPLVRASYHDPAGTYATNVMGVVNVLEAVRDDDRVLATVIVTTDKCYENREQIWPYRESDRLGGRDPYSNSKACAELVAGGYWWSYFAHREVQGLATGRAGNVLGGGDWSTDRLAPDLLQAFEEGRPGVLRRPDSVRPWQHVLEPLTGYLLAAERVAQPPRSETPPAWNFGPETSGDAAVEVVARKLAAAWSPQARCVVQREPDSVHEATLLTLDSTKARKELGWRPRWRLDQTIAATASWRRAYAAGADMYDFTRSQLMEYLHG